jgi:hypothetical protein
MTDETKKFEVVAAVKFTDRLVVDAANMADTADLAVKEGCDSDEIDVISIREIRSD